MTDIPNTAYITVKRDDKGQIGTFVGGEPETEYCGEVIFHANYVKDVFAGMQEENPNITEFHIGAFETRGKFKKTGKPSGKYGPNAWCRVVSGDIVPSSWVFYSAYSSATDCAHYCANDCANDVWVDAGLRTAVFGLIDKRNTKKAIQPEKKSQNPELKKLEQVDFSKLPKSPIELNGYRILVEEIASCTK